MALDAILLTLHGAQWQRTIASSTIAFARAAVAAACTGVEPNASWAVGTTAISVSFGPVLNAVVAGWRKAAAVAAEEARAVTSAVALHTRLNVIHVAAQGRHAGTIVTNAQCAITPDVAGMVDVAALTVRSAAVGACFKAVFHTVAAGG